MSNRNSLLAAVILITLIGLGLIIQPGFSASFVQLLPTPVPTATDVPSPSPVPPATVPSPSTPIPPATTPVIQQPVTLPRSATTSLTVINRLDLSIAVTLSGPQSLTVTLATDETKNFDIMPGTYHYRIDAVGYDSLEGDIAWPNTNPWEWTIIP